MLLLGRRWIVVILLLRFGIGVIWERLRRFMRLKVVMLRLVLLWLLIIAVLMPLLFKIVNLKVEGREVVLRPEKPGWDAVKSADLER